MAELVTEPPVAAAPPPLSTKASNALGLGTDPTFLAGTKRLGELGGERKAAQDAFEQNSAGLQGQIATERKAAADLKAPSMSAIPNKFEYTAGLKPEQMQEYSQTMFALAAIGGLMTRAPMTAALNGFAGALKGLQEGDKALYQRESTTFQTNLKTAIAKNAQAMQEYQAAFAKHKGNMSDLMNEWNIIAKKHGDTVSAINMERQDIQGMLRQIEGMKKLDLQATKMDQQFSTQMAQIAAGDRRMEAMIAARASEGALNRGSREQIERDKLALKEKAAAQGGKPSAVERQHYVDSNQLLKSVDRISTMLENPEFRAKVDSSQLGGVLSDTVESKALQQFLVRPNLDPDVKTYLNEIVNLRNKVYLDNSGKAVTGGEALRNYGAVVQPGETAQDTLLKMAVAKQNASEKMRDMAIYFPSLAAINAPAAGGAPAAGAPVGANEASEAKAAIAKGADAAKVRARYKERTGRDLD